MNINIQHYNKLTPLHLAFKKVNENIIEYLINKDADLHINGEDENISLHYSCKSEKDIIKFVKYLIEEKYIQNNDGWTPLHHAYYQGNENIVKYLIEKGTNLNISDNIETAPLHFACQEEKENLDLVKYLIEKKNVDINIQEINKLIPLYYAFINGHINVVKYLIDKGTDLNISDNIGTAPLHFACQEEKENLDLVKYLIEEKNVDANVKNSFGCTPLHVACENGNINIVKYLIDKGADINIKDNYGCILLHRACLSEKESLDLVKYLIEEKKMNMNIKDSYGYLQLKYANNKHNDHIENI
ncbi:ankyrin [Piromyces finnis]|uniref:Ankyrin n=1 Tax=Piromyces finnis TaxID=1754191 RepID=A0A1Y1UX80_9FUNG|nr:ankyrin [Piromyces finnis]|eukprot:ORX42282.1 ankyrin [Piromyces finnis]